MDRTGIAIVGASAAGLAAAIAAGREGADVTLIEAKDEIGVPPAPAITAMDFLWPEQIEQPEHTIVRRLAGTRLRAPDGRGPMVDGGISLIDRTAFDQHLAKLAEEEGVTVVSGVKDLEVRDDRSLASDKLELKPDLLMFADGARSQATKFMDTTRDPEMMQWVGVLSFEAPEPESDGRIYTTLGPHAPGGRSQLNPLGDDRWSHWTFYRGKRDQGEEIARRALAIDAPLMGWEDVDARFVAVGPDPLYTIPNEFIGDGVLATGGAAGQGGFEVGLHTGWKAGTVAAGHLAGTASLDEYRDWWHKHYQGKYENLRKSNDALMKLTEQEVCDVLGPWDGKHVHDQMRFTDLLRNPLGVVAVLKAGRIAKKRPLPVV